jgi:hypothetical protein
MHRFVLILMLILLPLRGWMGEAMAMDMLAQHALATQKVAIHAIHTGTANTFDTEIQAECHTATEAADPDTNHCNTCPVCQMCHSVAAPTPWAIPAPLWLSHAQPATARTRFASAPTAFALKPPIS